MHDGVSPYCVSPDSLQSSHKCYSSACAEGTVYPVDCESFRSCIGGKMRSVFCKAGLVHDSQSNKCLEIDQLPGLLTSRFSHFENDVQRDTSVALLRRLRRRLHGQPSLHYVWKAQSDRSPVARLKSALMDFSDKCIALLD